MSQKTDLVAQAQAQGLTLTGNETVKQLQALLAPATNGQTTPPDATPPAPDDSPSVTPAAPASRSSVTEIASYNQTVANMKKFLSEQPTVSIFIPLEPGEP